MAAIDPTARTTNARARIMVYLLTLAVAGAPRWVAQGDTRFRPDSAERWLRVTMIPDSAGNIGRHSATQIAEDARMLIVVDVFFRNAADEGEVFDLYAVDRAADDVRHGLTQMSLDFNDYSSDPASPTAVSDARIRVIDPPQILNFDPTDGFLRRQVTAEARWISRFTA